MQRVGLTRTLPGARLVIWSFCIWTVVAAVLTLHTMIRSPAIGNPAEWLRAAGWQLVAAWSWAVCTPAVIEVTRRAVAIRPWWKLGALHLAAGVAIAGGCVAIEGAVRWLVYDDVRALYSASGILPGLLRELWPFYVFVYGVW